MLGPDVVVAELQRLPQRQLEDLLGAGVNGMWPDGALPPCPMISSTWRYGFERDAERLERLGGDALTLVDQAQQDVLGPDEVRVEKAFLGARTTTRPGSIRETFLEV